MKNFTIPFDNVDELVSFAYSAAIDTPQTLIQIFCAKPDKDYIKSIQKYFVQNYPHSVLIGSTTDGIIDGKNVYNETKSTATFTVFEKTTLKSTLLKHEDYDNDSFYTGETLAKELYQNDTKVIISFADGIHTNGEEFVKGISSVTARTVLSGGLAGDNGLIDTTYIFDKEEIVSSGAIGVALNSDDLSVTTKYTFDWMPLGKKLKVTKAIKNRVYEIEGLSAVDIYGKYFGYELANKLPQVGIEFPLIFEKNGVSIGRAVLFKHNDGSLTFAGNIPEGIEVRFGVGNIERILQNSNYNMTQMMEETQYESEAVFVYSCMARRRFMNDNITDELEILNNIGNISGFFTYGEFFHSKENNQLLNETMTMLVLSENKKISHKNMREISQKPHDYDIRAEHVVANLANRVSQELAELNESLEQRVKDSSDYIYRQAYFDKLTGLSNRLSLIKKLGFSEGKLLMLLNIDDFATINDFYGHAIGDQILVIMAKLLEKITKDERVEVFKLPSDEYALLMERPRTKEEKISKIKNYLYDIAHEEFVVEDNVIQVSATIATAVVNREGTGFVNADMALKLAKKLGNDYTIYDENLKLSKQYRDNLEMAKIIKDAIANDRIVPYFQPLLNMQTGKVDKYEALVRLIKENGDVVSPFFFLGISEKIKVYPKITEIMIEKAFSYFKDTDMKFSINLSFSDILNDKTKAFLFDKIKEYKIASQLTVEILETQENDGEIAIEEFTKEVYRIGANIAIDDFGSGYANFTHMTDMQSDFMKIDGSLIKNINTDKNARLIVETIIVFARKLNKKIVAEYVHSKEVYEIIKELGIDYAQGYYLGEPLPEILENPTLTL